MPRKPRNPTRSVPWGYGFVQQRGNRYQARWREEQPDGTDRWRARTFDTRREAEAHLRAIGEAREDGKPTIPADRTVGDVVDAWLRHGKRRWKSNTYCLNRSLATKHILPELGSVRVASLTASRLQRWIDDMDGRLAPRSIRAVHTALSSALNEAVRLRILPDSPAHGLALPNAAPSGIKAWSVEEVQAVLAVLEADRFWRALYLFALTTGCRPGELRALQWHDIDLENRTATIRRTITRNDKGTPVIGNTTKTKRNRTVAITSATAQALEEWRAQQEAERLAAGLRWHDLDLVFTGRNGAILNAANWSEKHRQIIAAARVAAIGLHGTRHTAATIMLSANVPVKVVSEMLGHASAAITMDIYQHVSVSLQRESADALESRILGRNPIKQ